MDDNISLEFTEPQETDFLNDFSKTNYVKKVDKKLEKENAKEQKRQQIEMEKQMKQAERNMKRDMKENERQKKLEEKQANKKQPKEKKEDELFSDNGTEILGKERLIMIAKITQYKKLFPEELKGFRIKKKPSIEDLENSLNEIQAILSISNIDDFLADGILQSIRMIEGVSSNFKNYDVSGLSQLLKSNKQFLSLSKQLCIKYNCYSAVPPEMQMGMLVITTAWICKNKNSKRKEINDYLNETINPE